MEDSDIDKLLNGSESDYDINLLKKHVAELMKHFDTVQIFATRFKGGESETTSVNDGNGNWWARYGQVAMWVKYTEDNEIIARRE